MKIVYNRLDAEAQTKEAPPKSKKERKPSAKELKQERVNRMTYKLQMRDYKRVLKEDAKRIAEIQKHYPGWLPPPPKFKE